MTSTQISTSHSSLTALPSSCHKSSGPDKSSLFTFQHVVLYAPSNLTSLYSGSNFTLTLETSSHVTTFPNTSRIIYPLAPAAFFILSSKLFHRETYITVCSINFTLGLRTPGKAKSYVLIHLPVA